MCRKCKEEKSVAEMKRDPRNKMGFSKVCRICENERHKKYREAQKDKEEWQEKERQRHKKYNDEHREEIKEKQKKIRDEHKNEFFACESCQMLVKNVNVHNQTEYHKKNIIELKKMFVDWKNDLEIEKEKLEKEKREQKLARNREKSRLYYLAKKEKM